MREKHKCPYCGREIEHLLDEAVWEESKFCKCKCGGIGSYSACTPMSSIPHIDWFREGDYDFDKVEKYWLKQEGENNMNSENKLEYRYSVMKPLMAEHGITLKDMAIRATIFLRERDQIGIYLGSDSMGADDIQYPLKCIQEIDTSGYDIGTLHVQKVNTLCDVYQIQEFISGMPIARFRMHGKENVTMFRMKFNGLEQGESKMTELTTKIEEVKSEIESTTAKLEIRNRKVNEKQSKLKFIKNNPDEAKVTNVDICYEITPSDDNMSIHHRDSFKGELRVLQLVLEALLASDVQAVQDLEETLKTLNSQKTKLEAAAKLAEEALQ